jgi:hypothetical protein
MRHVLRLLVGTLGLLFIAIMATLWFNMGALLAQVGITPNGLIGRATVRADIAGLFGSIGLFALMAALRESRAWALGALTMTSVAIVGRLVGIALDGSGPGVWSPIIVEAVLILLLLAARQFWRPGL